MAAQYWQSVQRYHCLARTRACRDHSNSLQGKALILAQEFGIKEVDKDQVTTVKRFKKRCIWLSRFHRSL